MLSVNEADIDRITEALSRLIEGQPVARIAGAPGLPRNELEQLAAFVNVLIEEYRAFSEALHTLSRGDLDAELPKGRMQVLHALKNLQANLRHLTWKTQQVALGDFSQRVDFMGAFSQNFNLMVEQLEAARETLLRKNKELDQISRTDPLTGLLNRRGALELMEREMHRANRSKSPFVILLADIDHFKQVNDVHGHDAGDAVLSAVSALFAGHLRKPDLCARWGGEEFLVMLPDTGLQGAAIAAERLRGSVETLTIAHHAQHLSVTVSMGMSLYREEETLDACVKRSDLCLYQAKQAGRNQIWFQSDGQEMAPLRTLCAVPACGTETPLP